MTVGVNFTNFVAPQNDTKKHKRQSIKIEVDEDLVLCIQCESKTEMDLGKQHNQFSLMDEMFLRVYCENIGTHT